MWRDIERRAAHFGLEWNGIPPYPVDRSGLANRLGVIAGKEGWAPAFARAAYRAWFIDHKDFGQPEGRNIAAFGTWHGRAKAYCPSRKRNRKVRI